MTDLYNEQCDQITLTLEDGSDLVCDVLSVFPVEGIDYIALLPANDDPDAEIFLYRFVDHGDDDIELINIEDDEEFEKVSDAFDELLDAAEFDEMVGEGFEDEE